MSDGVKIYDAESKQSMVIRKGETGTRAAQEGREG